MSNRLKEIDFLRGIAIILVIFRHKEISKLMQNMGWIGVDLFFVLSGFLVSGLLFKEYLKYGNINAKLFLIRRGFKIYPIFYLTYILYIAPRIYLNKLEVDKLLYDLFFIQNYALEWGYAYAASWSLAVEEHFYFGLAVLFWYLFNKKKISLEIGKNSNFDKILIGILIIILIGRFFSNLMLPNEFVRNTTMTHLRIDSLLFGVLISYWYYFKREKLFNFYKNNKNILLITSFLMLTFTPFIESIHSFFVKTVGFTMIYLSFGIILIHFISSKEINNQINSLFSKRVVNSVSKIGYCSYSIYIIHSFVIKWVNFLNIDNKLISFILAFVLSVAVGIFMTDKIEVYFLNYSNKYFPCRIN